MHFEININIVFAFIKNFRYLFHNFMGVKQKKALKIFFNY